LKVGGEQKSIPQSGKEMGRGEQINPMWINEKRLKWGAGKYES